MLIEMLDKWKVKRGDIEFENTIKGFNVNLITKMGSVTDLVFWGQLDQSKSQSMMSRQKYLSRFC
jgi:hypothetical protein